MTLGTLSNSTNMYHYHYKFAIHVYNMHNAMHSQSVFVTLDRALIGFYFSFILVNF